MFNDELILFSQIITYVLLVVIVYEDFRFRGVSWYFFVLLVLILITDFTIRQYSIYNFLINALFVSLQLALSALYIMIKHKKWVNITQMYLGWGDIIFFYILCLVFSPVNFIAFYMISLFGTLSIVLIFRILVNKKENNIPLAGFQAIFLLLLMIVNHLFHIFGFHDDNFLLKFL